VRLQYNGERLHQYGDHKVTIKICHVMRVMMGYSVYPGPSLDNVVDLLKFDNKFPVIIFQLVFEI